MRVLRCGADAVLVEVDSQAEVGAVHAVLTAAELPDVVELVPAARTVLVSLRGGHDAAALVNAVLADADLTDPPAGEPRELVLPVRYDGPDLDLVAETAGIDRDEVVRLHTGAEYTVAFCGFAPGFGYLTGLPDALVQPRLDSPRTAVPPGSVGLADEFTGVYPRSSPGGWRLIGRLDESADALFDARRDPAAMLAPGDRVRFEALR